MNAIRIKQESAATRTNWIASLNDAAIDRSIWIDTGDATKRRVVVERGRNRSIDRRCVGVCVERARNEPVRAAEKKSLKHKKCVVGHLISTVVVLSLCIYKRVVL